MTQTRRQYVFAGIAFEYIHGWMDEPIGPKSQLIPTSSLPHPTLWPQMPMPSSPLHPFYPYLPLHFTLSFHSFPSSIFPNFIFKSIFSQKMVISLLFLLIVLTFGSIQAAEHPIESTTSSAGSNEKLSAGSQPSASPATQTASSSAEFSSSSSSQPPAVSPSAQPHPPGSEPAPSEQKVSGQSVEKEKAEENGVGGPPKDSGTPGKLGGSSSAESSGHSVSDQSSPSSPTANGVNGQYSGWIGSSLLTMIAIGALIA